jgi:signal transduction histidine kinase
MSAAESDSGATGGSRDGKPAWRSWSSLAREEQRILLLAPTSNDARLTEKVLEAAGFCAEVCRDMPSLCETIENGVGAIILAEEALTPASAECLVEALKSLPPWSEIPVTVITSGGEVSQTRLRRLTVPGGSGNVSLLERPFRLETLISACEVALRSRQRQYEVRDLLAERKRVEEALRAAQALLTDKAALLENTVQERTAKLQESVDELQHFSYTITHDMRAPLRAMVGFGSLLLTSAENQLNGESVGFVQSMMDGARRMDALIRDALQYTKILSGEIELAPIEPVELLRGIVRSYPAFHAPNVQIQIDAPIPAVMANEAGLLQCFSNLLGNAVKFVEPGKVPHVHIYGEPNGETVRIWFADNGIGIPQEYQDRIFGMFQQLDKKYEGTGIGLALVRKAAKRMGGSVGVQSKVGEGSQFWLEFKRAAG